MPVARVYLKWLPGEVAKGEHETYLIDIQVDKDYFPIKNVTNFGVWGDLDNPEDRWPLLLFKDGGIEVADKFQRTDILSVRLIAGAIVRFWQGNIPYRFEVANVEIRC